MTSRWPWAAHGCHTHATFRQAGVDVHAIRGNLNNLKTRRSQAHTRHHGHPRNRGTEIDLRKIVFASIIRVTTWKVASSTRKRPAPAVCTAMATPNGKRTRIPASPRRMEGCCRGGGGGAKRWGRGAGVCEGGELRKCDLEGTGLNSGRRGTENWRARGGTEIWRMATTLRD